MRRSLLKSAGRWLAGLSAAVALIWFAAPFAVDDPLPAIKARTPVRVWKDRAGRIIHYERTYNHEWRFDIPLSDVAPEVVRLMLNTEDARFYSHGGVDYLAAFRALWQNILSGRVISGASTISMQVAGMDYASRRRTFLRKFAQAAKARKMERLHSKNEILEAYFNNIPYGGKLYGIEAAARYYFGMTAKELTVVEASILCGIPQRPNRYRPDRHPQEVRVRQRRVLDALARNGKISRKEADRIFASERLRYRDFRHPASFERLGEAKDLLFVKDELSSYDSELTARVKRVLARRLAAVQDVHDAAAILIDNATGERRAYIGTMDFDRKPDGQFDAACGIRSAGSTLKPFIYAEAVAGGIVGPDTILLDAPVRWGSYAPGNYNGSFRGAVTATDALSHSLNTPVIRLLARLGEKRVTAAFSRRGLECPDQVRTNGLALALGSAGYRLVDLTRAYRDLAVATNIADRTVAEMLRSRPLAGTDHAIAWKTGTSNNNRDAWCFAFTPDWTLGVWFGNKSGERSPRLVGAEIAAPAAAEIFEMLYTGKPGPMWGMGVKAGNEKRKMEKGKWRKEKVNAVYTRSTTILSPGPGDYRIKPGETEVTFDLSADPAEVCWFADGTLLGVSPPPRTASFATGRHAVLAVPIDPSRSAATVRFSVSP